MKIRNIIFVIPLLLFAVACNKGDNGEQQLVDISNPRQASLEELGADIKVVPIKEDSSFILGNIFTAKSYGDMIFLFDDGHRVIHCLKDDGTHVCTLDAVGRSGNEYLDIGTFTYDDANKSLIIFERATTTLKFYDFPSMAKTKEIKLDYYVNTINWVGGNILLMVREVSEGVEPALVLYDMDNNVVVKEEKLLREDQADMVNDLSFTRMGGNEMYLCVSGPSETVYSVKKNGFVPFASFAFKPNSIGNNYWKGPLNEDKEDEILEALSEGGHDFAIMSNSFVRKNNGNESFYYVSGGYRGSHEVPEMSLCLIRGGKSEIFNHISVKGTDLHILPNGVSGRSYFAMIPLSLLKLDDSLDKAGQKMKELSEEGVESAILFYSF